MTDLRACIFIDQLQPQTLAYMSTWMRGTLPRAKMAAQIVEMAPGLDIEALTDVVLKSADVRAGVLVVERQEELAAPAIQASRIVTRIDDQHAYLMNRNKMGSMVLGGESVYLLECQPAAFAILACNEAEKAACIKVVDLRMIGAS